MKASYKDLEDYQDIFNRRDFNVISDKDNIKKVVSIIKYLSHTTEKLGKNHIEFVRGFKANLESFYDWSDPENNIGDIEKGMAMCIKELEKIIRLIKNPKRKEVSKGYLRKFSASFLQGLNLIEKGIDTSFQWRYVSDVNLSKDLIGAYLTNKKIGLGKKYRYNTIGRHSFMNKLPLLNKRETKEVEKQLVERHQKRTFNGWLDLGYGGAIVRILVDKKHLKKDDAYYLFRANEHHEYERQLKTPPDKCIFEAA